LEAKGRLANGRWTSIPTTAAARAEWFADTPVLEYICLIFEDIQTFVFGEHRSDKTMIYAGPSVPAHLQSTTAYPEAVLATNAGTGMQRSWADVICPFEFEDDPRRIEHVSLLLIVADCR
jgi:hypothetical protein